MVNKKSLFNKILLIVLAVLSLCGSSITLCFSSGVSVNRSAEAIVPEIKKTYHTRGSYGYIVAKLDDNCKPNNLSFYKQLLEIQKKYPSSHKNTFVRGRIFTIFDNDNYNHISINGHTDFSIVGIPEMENVSYSEEGEKSVSHNISYLGTALSIDYLESGYSGITDGSCFYTSSAFNETYRDVDGESIISINNNEVKLKHGGIIGPKQPNLFDRSSEIAKLCNNKFIFINQNLFKHLNQATIVFEISNSRQIDYDYTSLDADGKTKIDPLSFVLNDYIEDIVDFLNEYEYQEISIYKSKGNESSLVETNTDITNNLEKFVHKYLSYYRTTKTKLFGAVLAIVFLVLSCVWFYLITLLKNKYLPKKHLLLTLVLFDCATILLFILPPFILKNFGIIGLTEIKTFGIQFVIPAFIYLVLVLVLTYVFFVKNKKRMEGH